ncbi:hypothetical protein [Lignipirellula cremea]|uniref:Uncharacterized protein n=1 Tax=Lignipirellula cremea TaxID=2528010 RepID=A0A518DPP0_9BACT|nr:hypothetical protein [Lignipirellula cremea]QDU93783.1 hypothetical protein Pla8534_15660 [Lignipirellula cremea]
MTTDAEQQWHVVQRWQEYASEGRANLLRVTAVASLYLVQLIHHLGFSDGTPAAAEFHRRATWIVAIWSFLVLGVLLCLRRRFFPPALKFVTTGADLVLLTLTAWVGGKSDSPLVYVYFVVLILAALRLNRALILFAVLGAMAGYEVLVGALDPVWFDAEHATPVVRNLVMLASLGLAGIMLGQIVCRVRTLAEEYQRRMSAAVSRPAESAAAPPASS